MSVVAGSALAAGSIVASAMPAAAAVEVTGTSVTAVSTTEGITALPGVSVSGTSGVQVVTLTTDLGELFLPSRDGLMLAFGNGGWVDPSIAFTGTEADINTALSQLEFYPGSTAGTAHIRISVVPVDDAVVYLGATDHYYKFVNDPVVSWDEARSEAEASTFGGRNGYLAQIPSAAVNTLLSTKIQGAHDAWIGAQASTDGSGHRTWTWAGGPRDAEVVSMCSNTSGPCDHAGEANGLYHAWASGEPNNTGSAEDKAITNWNGTTGAWNDVPATEPTVHGYLVEYGDDVPFTGVGRVQSDIVLSGPPSAPTQVTAVAAGPTSVAVSWAAPAQLNGSTITSYLVTSSPGVKTCTAGAAATTCTVTGLTAGTPYTFSVKALSNRGMSRPTRSPSVTPTGPSGASAPSAPTAVSATAGMRRALVSWSAPSALNGATLTGYTVTATPGGATCSTAGARRCTVSGLTGGTRYTFRVVARSSAGNSAASTASRAVTAWARGVAATPTRAVAGDRRATISWTAAAPVGVAAHHYIVTAAPGGATCSTVNRTCVITGLVNGRTYLIRVTAYTAGGTAITTSRKLYVTPERAG